MKKILDKISKPIKLNLDEFNKHFDASLESEVKTINTIVKYLVRKKGKRLRPRLSLLSAKICGEINVKTYKVASLLEILHVATLVHDDVVDESDLRRGWPSVGRVWKNKLSILVGDYLFSKALTNMAEIDSMQSVKILANLASRLSQGEILQIEKAFSKNMTEDIYFKMIGDKTASLFSASCKLGAITSTNNPSKIKALADFGEYLGLGFQIKDDLFDLVGNINKTGKPSGYDLKRNLLTLPLIYILNNKSSISKQAFKLQLRLLLKKNKFNEIKNLIIGEGGVDYAENKLLEISKKARIELENFEDSDVKSAMIEILEFNLVRNV
tara:strand:+ start:2869 stop:3846 length:978 start_codon:yes stop_codon:yes gene_type:complete